jgi:uncharacterized protein YbaR (Trm112 family)/SAM-dependent methyltransferase
MKRYMLRHLVCPFTHSELSLLSFEEIPVNLKPEDKERCKQLGIDPAEASSAIKEGVLVSETSRKWFPIVNYVPIMLDFPTDLHTGFAEQYSARTEIFKQYELVDGKPRPGELSTQKSFTREWDLLNLDNVSFGYTPEKRDEFVRLEFDWPRGSLTQRPLNILEIGCGSGFESASLDRVTGGCIVGFDLNLALVKKGHLLAENPFVNTNVASLFALPLRPQSFDVVYSNGVLHHTYSTKAAFDSIQQYRKLNGLICIWVYACEDTVRTPRSRVRYHLEQVVRPVLARLPAPLQNFVVMLLSLGHYPIFRWQHRFGHEHWTFKDSEHAVRDSWTPMFAYRHTFEEVAGWMKALGLSYQGIDAQAFQERIGIRYFGIGVRGAPPAVVERSGV